MLQKNAEGNHRLRPSVARSRGGLQLLHFIRRRRLKQLDRFLPSNAAIVLVRLIGCSLVAVYFALWVMDVVISSTYERLLYSLYVCMLEKEFSPFRLNSSFRLGGGLGGGQFIYNIINANLLGRWICLWRSHSHYPAHKIQHELTAETVLLWVFRIIIICYERLLQHRFFSIFFFTYETSQQWFNLSSSFEILQTLSLWKFLLTCRIPHIPKLQYTHPTIWSNESGRFSIPF